MLSSGERVLVAVSGGPDSVAMLSVLSELAKELRLALHVFHLNHQLRRSATADAEFVGDLAERMGVPATIISFDVGAYCRERKLGIETGAREVRYRLMEEVAREVGAQKIATGHTLDDQVETFLMRLVRGAGPTGLRAIPPVRGRYVRPLIDAARNQVLEYCMTRALDFRVDATNQVPDQPRNLLRLEIIPAFKRLNPNLEFTIGRSIEILADEDEYMLGAAIEAFNELAHKAEGAIRIDRERFLALPGAIARRVIRLAVETLEPEAPSVDARQIEEALRQLRRGGGVEVHIVGGLNFHREYDEFVVTKRLSPPPEVRRPLDVPGRADVPELGLVLESKLVARDELGEPPSGERSAAIDAASVKGGLLVTTPIAGDAFHPFGMRGTKKLSDFFIDGKVPKADRAKVPVVRCDDRIVWVVGHRIDDRCKIGANTKRVVLLEATVK